MNARKLVAVAVTDDGAVAAHAGRALLWVVYDCAPRRPPMEAYAIRLTTETCMHVWHVQEDPERHPLHAMDAIIAGSGGEGLQKKLEERGVALVLTRETSPAAAVSSYMTGADG